MRALVRATGAVLGLFVALAALAAGLPAAALPVAALPVAAPAAPAPAPQIAPSGVDDFTFDLFEADYYLDLDDNGYVTTRVIETLVAVFPDVPQSRGLIRAIPDEAFGYDLDVQLQSVTDEFGAPIYVERYDTSYYDDQGELVDWVEFYLDDDAFKYGTHTYVIKYTLKNTIVDLDNGLQEFYWDINGDGWNQPFGSVTANIHLSDALRSALVPGEESCYEGRYGDRTGSENCTIEPTGDGFTASAFEVAPSSTLTVALPFEPGTVIQRVRPEDSWIVQVAPKAIAALIGLMIILAFVVRATLWRSPKPGIVIAQYDPPENQTLLMSAELIGQQFRGLPALFIDFAVRGMIRIIDSKPGTPDGNDKDRYELEYVDADGASPKELRVLKQIFGGAAYRGERKNPGRFPVSTGAALYALKAETTAQATKEGYRALPDARLPTLMRRVAGWAVLLFVPIWVYVFTTDVEERGAVSVFMWASIIGWIMLSIALVRPNLLTAKGAAARDYLLGMRLYLTVAEEQRMRFLQSPKGAHRRVRPDDRAAVVHLYERLLPYAVVWNVEREWIEQLRLRYQEAPPTWVDSSVITPNFVNAFTYSTTSTVRPIVTQSSSGGGSWSGSSGSSSFSGGSSGGGFSGGGGGGGGGGGR